MYVQIVVSTLYVLALSMFSTHRATFGPQERYSRQCELLAQRYGLTERERQVMLYVAADYSAPMIAERLSLTTQTVRSYKKHIYAKLGVHKHEELMRLIHS